MASGKTESMLVATYVRQQEASASTPQQAPTQQPRVLGALTGWKLYVTMTAAFIGFFLSLLDTTIVAVALPTIADDFDEFDRSTWIINAYLITYMGFAIIVSRLSDIFSRKAVEVGSFILFIAFSLGCALSRSMAQLIVFRALQGIAGSGLFSLCLVMCFTLIPFEQRSMVAAYTSTCMVTAGVLGPVLGGAITKSRTSSTWPWIFWINLPIAGLALIGLLVAWPSDKSKKTLTKAAISKIDFLGSFLLLAASALLVFALQEAGSYTFSWSSAVIVACLVLSGASFVLFVAWQWWLSRHSGTPAKIVFPINLLTRRVISAAILSMLFTGFTYFIAIVNIPQRSQIVSGDSPLMAGVKLLPLMLASAAGSIVVGVINRKHNLTPYSLILAAAFQVLGYGLMTTLGSTRAVTARQYGFQVFLGLGFGMGIVSVTRMMELQAEPQWLAVTQGALAQMRTLGGSVGLAIAVVVLNSQVKGSEELTQSLTASQESSLLRSPLIIETLSLDQQALIAEVFAKAFTAQMKVATYIAAACFVVSLFTLQREIPQDNVAQLTMREAVAEKGSKEKVARHQDPGDGSESDALKLTEPA